MAHADLIPPQAKASWAAGQDRQTLTLLRQARDLWPLSSPQWAFLERLVGLVLIHQLREVEGTFALERADATLETARWPLPDLEWLE